MAQFICNTCGHRQSAAESKIGKNARCPICHMEGVVVTGAVDDALVSATPTHNDGGKRAPNLSNDNLDRQSRSSEQYEPPNSIPGRLAQFADLRKLQFSLMPSLAWAALILLVSNVLIQSLILLRLRDMSRRPTPVAIADISALAGTLPVEIKDISTTDELPVDIKGVASYARMPVKIEEVASYVEMPVSINDVSTTDELNVNLQNHYIISGDPIPVEIVK